MRPKIIFRYHPMQHDNVITFNEAKNVLLDILFSFQHFCEENDIRFSLTYGSLIGCVREKNIIPWDDDIDLMVDLENLDKLMSKLDLLEKYGLCYYHHKNVRKTYTNEIRIYKKGFYRVLDESSKKYLTPLCIDIFLVGHVSTNSNKKLPLNQIKKIEQMIKYKKLLIFKNAKYKSKSFLKFIVRSMVRFFLLVIPSSYLLNKIDRLIKSMNWGNEFDYYLYLAYSIDSSRILFDKDLMSDIVKEPFANNYSYIIKKYDYFLTSIYGDWKTPKDRSNGECDKQLFIYRAGD